MDIPGGQQFEGKTVEDMLYKIDHPDEDSNESGETPSEMLDDEGNKIRPDSEETGEESEGTEEEEGDEGDEGEDEEISEETGGWDEEEEDEDTELSPQDLIKRNITDFHRNQMKCLDRHFLAKPGEQLAFDNMMIDCNGKENIEIQRFYNDIDWQIKDFLRQGVRDQLRPGFCDKIFMQCFEYVQNIEVFMNLNYNVRKSIKCNLQILLDRIENENYISLREFALQLIYEYDDLLEVLETKKELMAHYFGAKEEQYTVEYGDHEALSISSEEEEETEKQEGEESSETSEDSEDKKIREQNEKDKEQIEKDEEKLKEFNEDPKNVFNNKSEDGDAPFIKEDDEPGLEDAIPGMENIPTEYPDRPKGNSAVEVDPDEKAEILKNKSPEEIKRDQELKAQAEALHLAYLDLNLIRHDFTKMQEDPEYNELEALEPTPEELQNSKAKDRGLKKKEKMQSKIQKRLHKALMRAEKKIEKRNGDVTWRNQSKLYKSI